MIDAAAQVFNCQGEARTIKNACLCALGLQGCPKTIRAFFPGIRGQFLVARLRHFGDMSGVLFKYDGIGAIEGITDARSR